jgi:hypothetical protein
MIDDIDKDDSRVLSIIIVSWNVRELLKACLSSIDQTRPSLPLEVIVVDSGSHDGSQSMVQECFPWVTLIGRPDNVGFPKGNNIGINKSKGRHILLLNPDTEIIGNGLKEMSRFLDDNSDVGVVAAKLLNPDGSVQSSRRRFPTIATGIFESTWLEPIAPRSILGNYYFEDVPDNVTIDVDWVVGACLMVRRSVADDVGPLDEGYFMYSEELDWCRRIKSAGWRVVYLPASQIIHHIGKSSDQAVVERHVNFQRAKLRYFKKYHGSWAALLIRFILIINYAWQLVVEAVKGIIGHKRDLRWQRVRAYWTVLRSGLPPAGY